MNGPEDDLLDWHGIDWATCEENVRRLRQRIFKATQDGDLKKVRNLQKLMLRSRSNTLVSVKRVTQQSSGRMTAGIDGERALTPKARGTLAAEIHRSSKPWKVRPVKRVFIPKSNGKQRPLGIPVIRDRVLQARVKNALEPEWEARFEPRSYGFRPGRSCQDAISAIFWTVKGKNPKRLWVLDADLSAAFDRIDHTHLMTMLGQFPARDLIRGWLKAGVIDRGRFAPTEEGTPQGGVISPLLLNVALHGLEQAAGCQYTVRAGREPGAMPGTPVLVRYADDFVVLCHDEEQVHQVRARLEDWLEPRAHRPRSAAVAASRNGINRLARSFRASRACTQTSRSSLAGSFTCRASIKQATGSPPCPGKSSTRIATVFVLAAWAMRLSADIRWLAGHRSP
ncbi:reverse transcriptase domain-containing protein, partial [Streptomyces sp. NPDC005180]|uniref:reverse transcriptase domain-containing protein n=1 Tax=Streptomyces sp. NPDC005180 TaxID=3156868 RepID=UPI0033ABE013